MDKYDTKNMTLRQFLQQFEGFYIKFRTEEPTDYDYNRDFDDLEEFATSGIEFFLDLRIGELTSIEINRLNRGNPTITILYERETAPGKPPKIINGLLAIHKYGERIEILKNDQENNIIVLFLDSDTMKTFPDIYQAFCFLEETDPEDLDDIHFYNMTPYELLEELDIAKPGEEEDDAEFLYVRELIDAHVDRN